MEILEKLSACEEQVWRSRKELNELLKLSAKEEAPFVVQRIAVLKAEISQQEQQLKALEELYFTPPKESASPTAASQTAISKEGETRYAAARYSYPKQPYGAAEYRYPKQPHVAENLQAAEKKLGTEKNLEDFLGKSLMGVVASLLIFISLFFFAALVFPVLKDEIKLAAMFLFSGGLSIFGFYKLQKEKNSKIYMAVAGCGLGSLFIALFLSHVYFKVLPVLWLYVLLFCWALFVCRLAKTRSGIFQVIGQLGIFLSVIFGVNVSVMEKACDKLLLVTVYFLVAEMIYQTAFWKKGYKSQIINIGFAMLSSMVYLSAGFWAVRVLEQASILPSEAGLLKAVFLLMTVGMLEFMLFHYYKAEKSEIGSTLLAILSISGLLEVAAFVWVVDRQQHFMIFASLLVLFCNEWKLGKDKKHEMIYVSDVVALLCFALYLRDIWWMETYLFVAPFALLFAVYGFYAKKTEFKYYSLGYFLLLISDGNVHLLSRTLFGFGILLVIGGLMEVKEQYNRVIKNLLYIATLIFTWCIGEAWLWENSMMIEKTNFSILCLLTGVVHLIFRFSGYLNHWQEDREEKESTFVSNIINALLMLLTMFFISRADQEILHLCLILLSIALFLVNTVRLLEKKRLIFGIYVGVKFTILLWVILSSYQMPSMASSIGGLMLAAVGIALGFYKNYRSLRIYGLVLSMFSVVKLLLIDISYTNPLGRAAGFFVCGLLCFAISVLYNKLDRWIS